MFLRKMSTLLCVTSVLVSSISLGTVNASTKCPPHGEYYNNNVEDHWTYTHAHDTGYKVGGVAVTKSCTLLANNGILRQNVVSVVL